MYFTRSNYDGDKDENREEEEEVEGEGQCLPQGKDSRAVTCLLNEMIIAIGVWCRIFDTNIPTKNTPLPLLHFVLHMIWY